MARDFVDDVDAGHKLAAVVMDPFDCIVAVLPTSRRIGEVVASTLQLPLASVTRILRPDDPVRPVEIEITDLQAPTHARLLVVDDAVETGHTAIEISRALAQRGCTSITLAVPVCPKDSEALVRPHFEDVIAVVRPLMRRSLSWHYDSPPGNG